MDFVVTINNRSYFMPAPYVLLGVGDKKKRYNTFLGKLFRESLGMFGKLDKKLASEETSASLDNHISGIFKNIPDSQATDEWITGLLNFTKSLSIIKTLCAIYDQLEKENNIVFKKQYVLPKGMDLDIGKEILGFINENKETFRLISSYFQEVELPKAEEKNDGQPE